MIGRLVDRRLFGVLAAGLALTAATASHALTIKATFGSSITSLSNAAQVEASINNAIAFYSAFNNNVTVNIDFGANTSGLGESTTTHYEGVTYSEFTHALAVNSALNPQNTDLATAVANLKYGNKQDFVFATSADLRALGDTSAAGAISNTDGSNFDGVITLNTTIMNFTNTPEAGRYGATGVIQHEVDEVLGIGGDGGPITNVSGLPSDYMDAEDLYRYSGTHTASFTTGATAYFSIDGGVTNIRNFNPNPAIGDTGDWVASSCAPGATQFVQNYGACANEAQVSLTPTSPETMALQAVGFDLTHVPEPAAWALMIVGFGLTGATLRRRRLADRRAALARVRA